MRRRRCQSHVLFGTIFFILVLFTAGMSSAEFVPGGENAIPGQYIVTYKPNVAMNLTFGSAASNAPSAVAVANDLLGEFGVGTEEILQVYENTLEGFAVKMDEAEAKALANDPRVLMVEQDGWGTTADVQQNPTWGIDRVDQKDLPLSNSYTYNTKAANVHVYVLDTGLNASHTEFSGRVGNGHDAVGDGGGTNDSHGHGTHCAGTVLGTKYGVAKGATIHAVQVLDSQGSGQWSVIAAGADWVAANHTKPAVANMSIQGTGVPSATVTAINGMINAGVFVAGAAGNYNTDACTHIMGKTNAMVSAASNSSDNRWTSSNYGSCVDIFAPGESVTSASHTSNSGSSTMSGTSMASPHLAGVAALYLANNPNASPSTVQQAILDASTPNKINDVKGSPNKLLYSLLGGSPGPNVTADFSYTKNDLVATFSDKSSASGTMINSWNWDFGNGQSSTQQNPSHTYSKAGTYNVKLTVSDGKISDNTTKAVTVGTAPDGELVNGQSQTVSGASKEWKHFFVNVPAGSSNLVMKTSGGTGDLDLYTKFGSQPTSSSWDCRPYKNGNAEECTVASPQSGKYYVSAYGYSAFSNATIVASYDTGGTNKYNLTVTKSGQGTVTLDPAGGSYDPGTRVKLTASPSSGWTFSGWSGDLSGSTNPATITMNANKNVTATFTSGQPPQNSCEGRCGSSSADGSCWCDSSCASYGDCCADKTQFCGF